MWPPKTIDLLSFSLSDWLGPAVACSTTNRQTSSLSIFYRISNHKTSSQNISITLLQISLKLQEHRGRYWIASFRCHDNSDVVATLMTTNFYLCLIQLWWQFFQIFVYGDVVYAQTWRYWPWKTVSSHLNCTVSNWNISYAQKVGTTLT